MVEMWEGGLGMCELEEEGNTGFLLYRVDRSRKEVSLLSDRPDNLAPSYRSTMGPNPIDSTLNIPSKTPVWVTVLTKEGYVFGIGSEFKFLLSSASEAIFEESTHRSMCTHYDINNKGTSREHVLSGLFPSSCLAKRAKYR
jgi:hypothetical protein